MASRREERTRRSAIGSPLSPSAWSARARRGVSSIRAPIRRNRSMTARRVGLTPTDRTVSSASGWIAAATSQKAAADTSPGIRSSSARTRKPPVRLHATPSPEPSSDCRSTGTPLARSIRSVWSRVPTDSRTVERPSARRAARRIADFTWALGTDVVTSIARSGVRPDTVRGGRESLLRALSSAPIARRGSMIRATGRRRNDSSPSRVARNGIPASSPAKRRRLVPEFPQSRVSRGSLRPSTPGDTTR